MALKPQLTGKSQYNVPAGVKIDLLAHQDEVQCFGCMTVALVEGSSVYQLTRKICT